MNKTISNKMITKQECMILLGCLDLVLCSESIDKVSISGNVNITKTKKTQHIIIKIQIKRFINEKFISS